MITFRRLSVFTALAVAVMLGAGPVAADWSAGIDLYNQGCFTDAAGHFRQVVEDEPELAGWLPHARSL